MAKTSPLTGTGKKAQRSAQKDVVHGEKHRRQSNKEISKFQKGEKYHEATRKQQEQIKHHQKQYTTKEKNPHKATEEFTKKGGASKGKDYTKGLEKFAEPGSKLYKGKDQTDRLKQFEAGSDIYKNADFAKSLQQGTKLANQEMAPIRDQALANYDQYTRPEVSGQFAGTGSSKSSALTQALAASRNNLERDLHAQTSQLAAQYGSDIAHTNLNENARQQQMQYGASSDITQLRMQENARQQQLQYGAQLSRSGIQSQESQFRRQMEYGAGQDLYNQKFNANTGYANQRRADLSNLNNLALTSSGALQNAGIAGLGGAIQSTYNQPQPSQPNFLQSIIPGAIQGGASIGAAHVLGTALAAGSSQEIKENIKDYEKGLDIIQNLDVKQYDYTIADKRKDCVGLIAENVPEEIQLMIGNIKGIDVYGLVSILVNCVKQLDIKVKNLESK